MERFGVQDPPAVEAVRSEQMRTPDDVSAMIKLRDLGWGLKRIVGSLAARRTREALAGVSAAGGRAGRGRVRRRWTGWLIGWRSGSGDTVGTPTWCGRSWRPRRVSRSACGPWSGRLPGRTSRSPGVL